MVTEISSF